MPSTPPPVSSWDEVTDYLLSVADRDLAAGTTPRPSVVAFSGRRPIAVGVLRPLDERGPVPALIEVLALLLPLGVDRVALSLTGRAWSTEDPVPPVCEDGDLRQQVLLLVRADATSGSCQVATEVRAIVPGDRTVPDWSVTGPLTGDETPESPLLDALRVLLDHRTDLEGETSGRDLVAQLGRILLLGHALALAPEPTDRLVRSSAA